MINVGLNHMRVFNALRGGESDFDGGAQIDSDNVFSAPTRHALRVTTFPASAFEHNFPSHELRTHRCDPIEELLFVFLVIVRKLLPRPAETVGRGPLLFLDLGQFGKARNSPNNRKTFRARGTLKFAGQNLNAFFR